MRKLLIFDFDGTISDTKSLYYKVIYDELKKFIGRRKIDKIIDLGMSLEESLRKMGFSFVVSWFLRRKIMKGVYKNLEKVKKCRDVNKIRDLKEDKIIVSNSLKEFILPILKKFKLRKEFKGVYGAEDFSDKAEFIKNYIKENKIKKKDCYYIGDRAVDVEVAKRIGCVGVVILGKCAWNSKKEILKKNPDIVISDLGDLKEILSSG